MRMPDVKRWILSLASASALTQMVFAQSATLGSPQPSQMPNQGIILIQGGDKAPAAKVDAPPAAKTDAPAAKADAAPAAAAPADAAPAAEEKKADDGPWRLFPEAFGGFKVTGWVYGTGVYNPTNANTRYNGPTTMSDQEGVFLNQAYISISRGLKDCLSWGATFDTFYGNDYNASQSRGQELHTAAGWVNKLNTGQDYGIAFPQAYVEVGTTKLSLKVGHFWTPIGYMVVQAPGNFFNTQPYGFTATNPFTHWGALVQAAPNDHWSGFLGVVNGWDALNRPDNSAAVLFGGRYTADEKKWYLNFSGISGQEPQNLNFPNYANRTLLNTYLDYNVSDKVEVVLENNTGWQQNPGFRQSMFYNFNNFLFYKINDCVKAGLRYEYMHDPSGFVAGIRDGNPNVGPYHGNFQTIAAGLNWAPNASKNLMIRPEVRYDWFNGDNAPGNLAPYNAGNRSNELWFVVGAYYVF